MDDQLGLDSISFESFDWAPASGDVGSRSWRGKEVVLSEHFFPFPPDLPSLDLEELRLVYEGTGRRSDQPLRRKRRFLRSAPASSDPVRTTKVIELAVVRGTSLPIVRVVLRIPLPDRYAFVASLTLPLAECSWVVKVQAVEPDTTGIREAIALDSLLRGHASSGDQPDNRSADKVLQEAMASFDPYQPRWDGLVDDPLTIVRKHITLVEHSMALRPEVFDQTPFHG